MSRSLLLLVLAACGSSPSPESAGSSSAAAAKPAPWRVPAGWKSETIPFPLEFAPSLAHRGAEELRFPPGMFDPDKPGYWSYAFTWRTEDAAELDSGALSAELTAYFKGLLAAVDEKQHRIKSLDEIVALAVPAGPGRFELSAKIIDAFKTAEPVDLVGWTARTSCGSGALWVFVLARAGSPIRGELDALAREAGC